MLWLSDSQQFSFFGFFGLIVTVLYFLFIYVNLKTKKHSFKFSVFVLLIYFILVFWVVLQFNYSITFAMRYWYQPLLLCIIVDGAIYLNKKYNKSKESHKKNA